MVDKTRSKIIGRHAQNAYMYPKPGVKIKLVRIFSSSVSQLKSSANSVSRAVSRRDFEVQEIEEAKTRRSMIWQWNTKAGMEFLALDGSKDRIRGEGVVVMDGEIGATVRVNYSILCDAEWRFSEAEIEVEWAKDRRTASITKKGAVWFVNGERRSDLAACSTIDMQASVLPNAFPICTNEFMPGTPVETDIAFVTIPNLEVIPTRHEYTLMEDHGTWQLFHFRSLTTRFTADLRVDSDGVPIDFEGFMAPSSGS